MVGSFLSHDVTKFKALQQQLRENSEKLEGQVSERTKQLQAALEVKSRFLAIMSHGACTCHVMGFFFVSSLSLLLLS